MGGYKMDSDSIISILPLAFLYLYLIIDTIVNKVFKRKKSSKILKLEKRILSLEKQVFELEKNIYKSNSK